MIATLTMYDRAESALANDRLYSLFRGALGYGPDRLNRDLDLFEAWTHPNLLLSQTCSLPFVQHLRGKVQLIGHPDFQLPDCPAGCYFSYLIGRKDDHRPLSQRLKGKVAINQDHSQSGWGSVWRYAQTTGAKLGQMTATGAHQNSARAVADGTVDVAAIDANTWRQLRQFDRHTDGLTILAHTPPTPATPYICGPDADASAIQRALASAIAELGPEDRQTLGLFGLVAPADQAMLDLPIPPEFAEICG